MSTEQEKRAARPLTMSAADEKQARVEFGGHTIVRWLLVELDAERAAHDATKAQAHDLEKDKCDLCVNIATLLAQRDELLAALEGAMQMTFGRNDMGAFLSGKVHSEHGGECLACIARAVIIKVRAVR